VEDGQVRIVGLRSPNQNPSVLFTTLPGRRHFLESEDVLVPPQWMTISAPWFGNGGIGELPDSGPPSLSRYYRVRAEVGTMPVVLYANDFENVIGPEWNVTGPIATTPASARKFLGEFGNETVTLQLAGLPPHTQIKVSFDLFILKSWDGNRTDFGPDRWMLAVRDGATLVDTTFAQYADGTQAFPGSVGASYAGLTGAIERGTLGYVFGGVQTDSVYRLSATFDHTAASVTLDFRGLNLQEIGDESWGLDNVRVEAIHVP